MIKTTAIRVLYPQVVVTHGDDAFDEAGNQVHYDEAAVQALMASEAYKEKRAAEYPNFIEYLDGVVKGDQAQIDAYIAACQAVKAKYPKP